jgi:hypothetical protein
MITGKQVGMGRRDFAREKRQGTPRDNLTLDAMDAERAGMSYGKYKAMHPNTKDANEARLAAKKREPKPPNVYALPCRYCGRIFESPNKSRRYCSDECKTKNDGAKWRHNKRDKKKKAEE